MTEFCWVVIFAAIFAAIATGENDRNIVECIFHTDCTDGSFCAASSCSDALGRKYLCGACKPCSECVCNADAVDGACPISKCPEQPTNSVRFLQGPFFARALIHGFPTHVCVRRLLFDAGSFFDVQAAIRIDHPASAEPVNETTVGVHCPAFTRVGVLVDISAPSPLTGEAHILDVVVTSEGPSR